MTAQAESGSDPSGSAPAGPSRIGSGRAGPVRVKLRRAVAEARAGGRMTAEHEVRALLADRYAALVDAAVTAGDGPGLLRAGDKLLELLDTLPIRRGGEPDDSGGDDRGKLYAVLDSPAAVGNPADS